MKAITVRQPWAWAIMRGGKDVENRTRNLAGRYRGPVVIHAGIGIKPSEFVESLQTFDRIGAERPSGRVADLGFGVAVGVVDLVGVHISRMSHGAERYGEPVCFDDHTPTGRLCSRWAQYDEIGIAHLVLANPRPFAEPIPYRGRLGLWEFPDHLLPEGFRS